MSRSKREEYYCSILFNFSVIFKLYLDFIFPKIYLSNGLSDGEMLVYMYLVRCFVRRRKKLTEITSITDKFANRF